MGTKSNLLADKAESKNADGLWMEDLKYAILILKKDCLDCKLWQSRYWTTNY